jgi:hypothetical protein
MLDYLRTPQLSSTTPLASLRSHPLLTSCGLEIFLTLSHHLFTAQQWLQPTSLYDSSYTSFETMDFDFLTDSLPPSSSSSSVPSTSKSSSVDHPPLHRKETDKNKSLILFTLCDLFSALPLFVKYSDELRRLQNESLHTSFQANRVDYNDLSLFLCTLCLTLDIQLLQPLLISPETNLLLSPLWLKLCESLSLEPSQPSQAFLTLSTKIESNLLTSSHPAVAICAIRLLSSLAMRTNYRSRIPSLLWFLLTTLHESNKKILFPVSRKSGSGCFNRNGLLSQVLDGYLAEAPELFASSQPRETPTNFSSSSKKTVESQCRSLLSQATSLSNHSRGASFSSLAEQESFGSFVILWGLWWKEEQREEGEESPRVYGVFLLLWELFQLLKKKKVGQSSKHSSALPGVSSAALISTRRTSRVKKPVDRYQPEQLTGEVEESDSEVEEEEEEEDEVIALKRGVSKQTSESLPIGPSIEREPQPQLNDILLHYQEAIAKGLSHTPLSQGGATGGGGGGVFRRVHSDNAEKYFSLVLSFLPTLLYQVTPLSSPSHSLQYDSRWGPYACVIFAVQTLLFTVSEFILLIAHDPLLLFTHSLNLIRVLKVSLLALEQTLLSALHWRTNTPASTDEWTSTSALVPLFHSALVLLETMSLFSQTLTNHLLSSSSSVPLTYPKKLIQSLPQLTVSIDRTRGKVRGLVDSHRLSERMTTHLQESEGIDSFQWLIARCRRYSEEHQRTSSRPFEDPPSQRAVKGARDTLTPAEHLMPSPSRRELLVNERQNLLESQDNDNGFRVSTAAGSFGWGIYK